MNSTPYISVVIAVYNGAKHLLKQMDALIGQSCDFAWEAIYVDNGSTDESREIISTYITEHQLSWVRLVDGSQKRGQVYARNLGCDLAQSDRLAFTDQDDLPAPTWLAEIAKSLQHAEVVGGLGISSPHGYPMSDHPDFSQAPENFNPRWCGFEWNPGNNIGIHRQVLQQVGGWQDIGVRAGEDVDLCIRLHLAGYRLVRTREARVYWRARTKLRDVFKQGITYGRSEVIIYKRYREHGAKKRTLREMLRITKQSILALKGVFRHPRNYLGVHKVACLCGRLYENLRSHVIYI